MAQVISDESWSIFITKLSDKVWWFGETVLKIERFESLVKDTTFSVFTKTI